MFVCQAKDCQVYGGEKNMSSQGALGVLDVDIVSTRCT